MLLSACSGHDRESLLPPPAPPIIPAVSPDIELCRKFATNVGSFTTLTDEQSEKFWQRDRISIKEMRHCLDRLLCSYHGVRKDIGQVENEPVCTVQPATPVPAPKKKLFGKRKAK